MLAQVLSPVFFVNKTYAEEAKKSCEDNPPVCSATPESMSTYLEFQKDMANLLNTNGLKTATETMSEGKWGLFTSQILQLTGLDEFSNSLIGQSIRVFDITASRSAISIVTAVFLFELAAVWALLDNTIELSILFQERPIVRDWSKALDVEWSLNQVAYNLWRAGDIGKTVVEMDKVNAIVKKYQDKGLLTWDAFWSSARYTEIILELAAMNSAVKWFLAYDNTSLLKNYKQNDHSLEFDSEWIEKLNMDYECARWTFGFKCSSSWANLKKSLQLLWKNTANKWRSSVQQIKDSFQNLKESLGNWSALKNNLKWKSNANNLSEREKQLLQWRYGLNTSRITKEDGASILSLNSNIPSLWAKASKTVSVVAQNIANWAQALFSTRKGLQEKIDKAKKEWNLSKVERLEEVLEIHDSIFPPKEAAELSEYAGTELSIKLESHLERLQVSENQAKEIAVISNNVALTNMFNELDAEIDVLKGTIGDKWKQNTLREVLKSTCDAQCENKWNDCCYVQ